MYHSPLKLYEYMAMGKAVVASDYDDARGLVADTGGGVVFVPGDLTALKAALRTALERATEWTIAAPRIRQVIIERHSWVARVRGLLVDLERLGIRSIRA
jgi:glycosyltransferase involved in cell wall biosynthesis